MTGHGGWPMTVFLDARRPARSSAARTSPASAGAGCRRSSSCAERIDERVAHRARRPRRAGRPAHRRHRPARPSSTRGDGLPGPRACSTTPPRSWSRQHDRRVGRLRRRAEVPPGHDLELCCGDRRRPAGDAEPTPRRLVARPSLDAMAVGRHLRPPRRRLRPLLGRRPLAGAPLREDALRPGPAGPGLPARLAGHRRGPLPPGARRDRSATCCATCATRAAGSSRPRTPTARARRASSTSGRRTRCAPSSAVTRRWPPMRRGTGVTPRRQLRGPQHPQPAPRAGATCVRPPEVEDAPGRLFDAREQRVRPGLDDKVLTEWNGLMLATLAEAAAATGREPTGSTPRVANGEFLLRELRRPDGRWLRSWQADGGARHLAYAADHAALVDAFVRLAEATGEARWIAEARPTADALLDLFWDADARRRCSPPAATPRRWSPATKDLHGQRHPRRQQPGRRGPAAPGRAHRRRRATASGPRPSSRLAGPLAAQHPTAFAHLLGAVDLLARGTTEVVVAGDRPDLRAGGAAPLPAPTPCWPGASPTPRRCGRAGEDGRAYVCRDYACQLPAEDEAASPPSSSTADPPSPPARQ